MQADIFSFGVLMYEVLTGTITSQIVVGPTGNARAAEVYAAKASAPGSPGCASWHSASPLHCAIAAIPMTVHVKVAPAQPACRQRLPAAQHF